MIVQEKEEIRVLRGGVHDEKQRTGDGALGNTEEGGIQGRESVVTSDTEGVR